MTKTAYTTCLFWGLEHNIHDGVCESTKFYSLVLFMHSSFVVWKILFFSMLTFIYRPYALHRHVLFTQNTWKTLGLISNVYWIAKTLKRWKKTICFSKETFLSVQEITGWPSSHARMQSMQTICMRCSEIWMLNLHCVLQVKPFAFFELKRQKRRPCDCFNSWQLRWFFFLRYTPKVKWREIWKRSRVLCKYWDEFVDVKCDNKKYKQM